MLATDSMLDGSIYCISIAAAGDRSSQCRWQRLLSHSASTAVAIMHYDELAQHISSVTDDRWCGAGCREARVIENNIYLHHQVQ
jgi:hypothetical protein